MQLRLTLAGVAAGLVLVWACWWFGAPRLDPARLEPAGGMASLEPAGARSSASAAAPHHERETVDAAVGDADKSSSPDVDALIFDPPPDAPNHTLEASLSPEFQAQLLIAAQANPTEDACREWARLLTLALADDASEAERRIALLNVSDACARTNHSSQRDHDLRLAHEALVQHAAEDPSRTPQLDAFSNKHPALAGTRAALLVADPEGSLVWLDGQNICTEPCTLAVPVDGVQHRISFSGPAGRAAMSWAPATRDERAPALPELSHAEP